MSKSLEERMREVSYATIEACGDYRDVSLDDAIRIAREYAEERVRPLREALLDMRASYACGCEHPACHRCRDNREVDAILAAEEARRAE